MDKGTGAGKVSANTTNTGSPRLAGVQFLRLAGLSGWRYSDGSGGPPRAGRLISETCPYATLVGAAELGYDTERPRYKRKPRRLRAAQWRTERAATCDTLIERLGRLADADPPLLLHSHPVTRELAEQPSPVIDSAYKHREDLIDALLCAWTASLWTRHGFDRCQVLGLPANATGDPAATMIVPARPEQRLQPLPKSALSAAEEYVRDERTSGDELGPSAPAGQDENYSSLSQRGLLFRFKTSIPVSHSWRISRRSRLDRNSVFARSSTKSRPSGQVTRSSTTATETVCPTWSSAIRRSAFLLVVFFSSGYDGLLPRVR